ncbi:MAG TPA: TolC family protein [Pyrinomonadaceae bacterium]|nr:TolC family protein [Pyrinomonadaceae bacterium]
MKRFLILRARALFLLCCLLGPFSQLYAQQPAQTPQPPNPHGQMHTPRPPAPAPSGEARPAPQELHDKGAHPPFYDYPFGSPVTRHRSVTVEQAVEMALQNASLYQQSRLDERIAAEDIRQARAAFLPQLSIPLTYTGTTSSRFRVTGDPLTYSFLSASGINETSAFVRASGTVDISGRLRAALRRSRAQLAAAHAGTEVARRALVISTVDAYYGLALARQNRRLADETLALAEAFVKIAENLKERGEVGDADVLRARSAALLRRNELEQARAAESAAMDLLRVLTGVDFATHIAHPLLTDDLPTVSDFASYTEELLKQRPELRQIESLKSAAMEDARAARRELWPDLTYSLSGGFDAADFRPLTRYSGGQAVVSLNIPVFNWGASRSRETQARLRAQSLDLQRESALQQLRQEFYTARANALSAIERAGMTRAATEASQRSLTLAFASYRLKKGTILDVIDAQANYAAARLAYYQAIADYRTNRIRLEVDPGAMNRAANASAQALPVMTHESCSLDASQAPAIAGLRLGMSLNQAQALFPSLLAQADESGIMRATLRAAELGTQPREPYLAGVDDVELEFRDNRLTYIRVDYPVTNRWESTDEFLAELAPKLNLRGTWKLFYDWEHKEIRDAKELRDLALECKGFRISAGIGVEGLGRDQTPHFALEEITK